MDLSAIDFSVIAFISYLLCVSFMVYLMFTTSEEKKKLHVVYNINKDRIENLTDKELGLKDDDSIIYLGEL